MNLTLNFEGFEQDLITRRALYDGVQYVFRFKNQYGASVIKHRGSYGHKSDLWELAVIVFDGVDAGNEDWDLTYETPITDDVEGCLSDYEVQDLLQKIKEL